MKTEGRNAVFELLKTDKNIDKILMVKNPQGSLTRFLPKRENAARASSSSIKRCLIRRAKKSVIRA